MIGNSSQGSSCQPEEQKNQFNNQQIKMMMSHQIDKQPIPD